MSTERPSAKYGVGARLLHWATVVLLIAQFTVGYLLDDDDSGQGRGRGRGRGRGGESGQGRGRGRGGDDDVSETASGALDSLDLRTIHIVLGVTILVVVLVRVMWRRRVGLPPWDPSLSPAERQFATWTERLLLGVVALIPVSGLLVLVDDDWVGLHVATHVALFVLLALHVGFVLGRRLLGRPMLLRRML